jgi:hypothetical protein
MDQGQQTPATLFSCPHEVARSACPGVGRTIKQRLRTLFRPSDDHAYEEALVELKWEA